SRGYKWNDIIIVTDSELELYPSGENVIASFNPMPNGSLLTDSGYKVYLIENGKKRWIPTEAIFNSRGYKWNDIIIVTDSELELYPSGENVIK
ncbi:MAG: hypothetical protein P1P85_00600, partial [Patescibacteria group bacterium]|nr:hypothetical protein [Patescibacteria group bacterium]